MVSTDLWFLEQRTEMLRDIGSVTVHWAALDLALANVLTVALKNRPAAMTIIFASHNAGAQRLEVFKDVVGTSTFNVAERDALISLAQQFKVLLSARNDIIHSPRVIEFSLREEGDSVAVEVKGLSKAGVVRSLANVREHIEQLSSLLTQLDEVFDELAKQYGLPDQIEMIG